MRVLASNILNRIEAGFEFTISVAGRFSLCKGHSHEDLSKAMCLQLQALRQRVGLL